MSKINIFWTSPEHRTRFLETMQRIGKVYNGELDAEYAAAIYILTSSLETWEKSEPYIEWRHDHIDFEDMFKHEDFSGGYSVLIYEAWNLFNSYIDKDRPVSFSSLLRLDPTNHRIAIMAQLIRAERLVFSQI